MKRSNITVEQLKEGDVLLTRVRKIHNYQPGMTRDGKNFKVQIEGAEYIDNPFRPTNAASIFNEGDQRFAAQTPRRGWVTMEPSAWDLYFGEALGVKSTDIEALEFSSTSAGDVASPAEQKEKVHFIYLGVLNPTVTYDNKKYELHVRITESTRQRNAAQKPKLNPSNNEVQTLGGHPIFVQAVLDFGKQKSTFLLSDQMREAILQGSLPVSEEVLKAYNLEVPVSVTSVTGPETKKSDLPFAVQV